jgi:hypothetical protein
MTTRKGFEKKLSWRNLGIILACLGGGGGGLRKTAKNIFNISFVLPKFRTEHLPNRS